MWTEGVKALDNIKESSAPQWLAPSPHFSADARNASKFLFSQILPHAPKCPLSDLLTDNFDAEQIWQQIDLQAQPLLSSLKSRLKNLLKTSQSLQLVSGLDHPKELSEEEGKNDMNMEDEDEEEEGDEEGEEEGEEDGEEEEEELSLSEEEEEDKEDGKTEGVEDKFLKINDLEKFLEEAEQLSLDPPEQKSEDEDDEDDDEEEEEEEEEGEDEMDGEEIDDDIRKRGQHDKSSKQILYKDFFGGKKRTKLASHGNSDDTESSDAEDNGDELDAKQPKEKSSTHERHMKKIQKKIEELEKANLDTKTWTMQGEVTATKRPKNSALEVELEFDHNMRPAPVITEEVTASLEDIIKRRIAEEQFDDVQRKPALPSTAPKERVELDENKSEKGLAELYEAEYMQRTGLAAAPTSSSDALKNEAALLFKKLCVKLDALSHFHFTPKPVIEDMSIQANVPALAMEEVAPLAVSEASMLAPEELFVGEGVVKEEAELTQEDRKRLRAKKKRKLKAVKANKEVEKKMRIRYKGNDEEKGYQKSKQKDQKSAKTHYGKSSKVFAELDLVKDKVGPKSSQKKADVPHPSFLKL
ncbi:hypothetical protein SUGI_0840840 [Cryptomeria japonica]|uniref:M phase phosphoprotein 10 n=1 Tax=Cryptomeria japonica TaxID=3369 RepID=UPI002414A431|nr:M phase phosphoprotein 10 [Cryptomeria japonica]GLJ40702.1 hypothetical protein SUGI_0840840 [Cryptomeria japonica]